HGHILAPVGVFPLHVGSPPAVLLAFEHAYHNPYMALVKDLPMQSYTVRVTGTVSMAEFYESLRSETVLIFDLSPYQNVSSAHLSVFKFFVRESVATDGQPRGAAAP